MDHESVNCADNSFFCISSSINTVLYGHYSYDYSDVINPHFAAIMDILDIHIDAWKLETFYFDQKVGEGELWVIGDHKNNCLIFSLYRDLTDQMDVINFGVICSKENNDRIFELMNSMYKESNEQIGFESYDITEKRSWLSAVLAGESQYSFDTFTLKIRYAESFADFCKQNNIR
jgi:hypothetical protein